MIILLPYSYDHLRIFDAVSSTGKMVSSEVKTLLKKDPLVIAKYLSITTLHNKSLTLSADHLVYARKCDNEEFNAM